MSVSGKTLEELALELASLFPNAENDLIESDMLSLLVDRPDWPMPLDVIPKLGYEIVYQRAPDNWSALYRGIRLKGVWAIDRRPEWPLVKVVLD